jgi:hypothetical protein
MADDKPQTEPPERQWRDPSLAKLHAAGDVPVIARYLAGLLDHLLAVVAKTFSTASEKSAELTVKRVTEAEVEVQKLFEATMKRLDTMPTESTAMKRLDELDARVTRHAEHLARLETRMQKERANK